jgi:hypothetical protein
LTNDFALAVDVAPANANADWGEAILEVECLIEGWWNDDLAGGVDEPVFRLPHS